jgi:uncharacterized membrane protein SpoIIM required for sporulation
VLDGRPPAVAGVRGVRADWRPFLGLRLLRTALLVPAGGLAVVGVGAVGLGPAGVLAGLLLLALSALLAAGATLALAFAAPAVVVDGVGTWTAVRRSVATYRDRPRTGVAYVVVLAGLVAGGGAVALGLAAAGVPRVVGLVATLAVPPVLDGVKTALYADRPLPPRDGVTGTGGTATTPAGAADLPPAPSPGPVARLAAGLRRGLGRLGAFVRTHPGAVAAGAGVFAAAGALVYATVAGYGVALDVPGDAAGAFGEFPVALFLDVAANNWLVAATGAYGGLAAGLPTVAALAFNGALVGGLVAVVPARATLGLVVPHAVVELPALAVAGGLGLHLGRVGVGALRGRASDETVAAELTEAFRVLVGLGVLFVVAAFVEAFVTPRVAAALLG